MLVAEVIDNFGDDGFVVQFIPFRNYLHTVESFAFTHIARTSIVLRAISSMARRVVLVTNFL
nr:MAG TPA: Elongation-Factor P (EF-P) rhamnosyltransferase EarP [Crassvirales sp.]